MRSWTSFSSFRLLKPCALADAMKSASMLKILVLTMSSTVAPGYCWVMERAYSGVTPWTRKPTSSLVERLVKPAAFMPAMKAAGFTNLSTKELVGLRVQGVTPEYARSITQQYPGATVEDIVKTKIFNIDADFIASAKAHGFNNLKLEKLVQLRISGLLDDEK